jgi:hypothetical protein
VKKQKKLRFPKKGLPTGCHPNGSEIVDPKPTELRAKAIAPATMRQKMQQLWKEFDAKKAESKEFESLEDAGDFDVENDKLPLSGYETDADLVHVLDALGDDIKELAAKAANVEPKAEQEPVGREKEQNDVQSND